MVDYSTDYLNHQPNCNQIKLRPKSDKYALLAHHAKQTVYCTAGCHRSSRKVLSQVHLSALPQRYIFGTKPRLDCGIRLSDGMSGYCVEIVGVIVALCHESVHPQHR